MPKDMEIIVADGTEIALRSFADTEYISLTDIARSRGSEPNPVIQHWMRSRNTIEYLGLWESLYNPNFLSSVAEDYALRAGSNSFALSPKKWIQTTNAIGIQAKSGRYGGGTYAHTDIAFEFASWVSPKFKLYLFKEYQRLKGEDGLRRAFGWLPARELAQLSGDAGEPLPELTEPPEALSYDNMSDEELICMALFGVTEEQWKAENPEQTGGIMDHATFAQGLVYSGLVSLNQTLRESGMPIKERLRALNENAIGHMKAIEANGQNIKKMDNDYLPMPPQLDL